MGRLRNRFRNRWKIIPLEKSPISYRASYTSKDFKASCISTLARLEKYKYERT